MNPETQAESKAAVPQMASTPRSLHTPGPWLNGIGPDGITGPNTPVVGGPTCGESVATMERNRLFEMGDKKSPWPQPKHICVCVGQDTLAIVVGSNREANARLIAAAPELLAACKFFLGALEDGDLVRDTSKNHRSDWSLKALKLVSDLKAAQEAVSKAEGAPSDLSGNVSDNVTGASNKDLEEREPT